MTPPAAKPKKPTKAEAAKALKAAHRELLAASYDLALPEGNEDETLERATRYAKARAVFTPALEEAQAALT